MKYTMYSIAALVGFHARWILYYILYNSTDYAMNGADIMCAIAMFGLTWGIWGLVEEHKRHKQRKNKKLSLYIGKKGRQ